MVGILKGQGAGVVNGTKTSSLSLTLKGISAH